MTTLTDNFAVDTGQITTFIPNVTSGGSPWIGGGSAVITSGKLLFTAPASSSFSVIGGVTASENAWTIPAPNLLIEMSVGSPTWQLPAPSGQINFGCGIVKDASNCVMCTVGPETSSTTLSIFIYGIIAGVAFGGSAGVGTIPITSLPDGVGFGLVGNIVTVFLSFGGVWQQITSIGAGGDIDISSFYDFTAPGALTGWSPGFIFAQSNNNVTTTIAAAMVKYTTPFFNPVLPSINVYGKFVPASTFKAIMVANPGSINPRIYPPQEDVTVRVKT